MEALEMFGLGLAGVIWSRGGSHEVRSTSKLHKWSKRKKECDFYMRAAYLLHCVWETCAKNLIFFLLFFSNLYFNCWAVFPDSKKCFEPKLVGHGFKKNCMFIFFTQMFHIQHMTSLNHHATVNGNFTTERRDFQKRPLRREWGNW